jgi:preprotein translocase subunit SecF
MDYRIIQKRSLWLSFSTLLFIFFGLAIIIWGLKFGIDFTGGSILEVKFSSTRPEVTAIQTKLSDLKLGSLTVQPVGETNISLRFQETAKEKHDEILKRLDALVNPDAKRKEKNIVEEIRYDSVGPSVGAELKSKAVNAIFWVFVAIVIYISIAFHKVSKPVSSWKYGVSALLAMFHDVIITIGVFAVLGKFFGVEINTPFVAAVLTVLGYSIHDTIVVFDRIRENLPKSDSDFEGTVNVSLNQTLGRSINTSLTVLLTLVSIIVFGGESIRSFALALTVGIFIGTYSSIFVASPLLVVWERFGKK